MKIYRKFTVNFREIYIFVVDQQHIDIMIPIENKNIKKYLEKICEDATFANYHRYKDLLMFIVSESINGKHIKEFNIAIKLYGDNISEDKSDGRVRVYMHNLRKKLDRYYEESGQNDEIIFALEKGSYNIQFKERKVECKESLDCDQSKQSSSLIQINNIKKWSIIVITLLLLATITIFINQGSVI